MTVTVFPLVQAKYIEPTDTTQFIASTLTTIDAVTVTNTSSVNASLSINVVEGGVVVSGENRAVDDRTLRPGESYPCPELVGQVLAVGDFISAIASSANSLSIRISGKAIT